MILNKQQHSPISLRTVCCIARNTAAHRLRSRSIWALPLAPIAGVMIFAVVMLVPLIVASLLRGPVKPFGIVDESGILTEADGLLSSLQAGERALVSYDGHIVNQALLTKHIDTYKILLIKSLERGKEILASGDITYLLRIPPDHSDTANMEIYANENLGLAREQAPDYLKNMLIVSTFRQKGYTKKQIGSILTFNYKNLRITKEGEIIPWKQAFTQQKEIKPPRNNARLDALAIASMYTVLLVMVAVPSEFGTIITLWRKNNLVEILLASSGARELYWGTLLGALPGLGVLTIGSSITWPLSFAALSLSYSANNIIERLLYSSLCTAFFMPSAILLVGSLSLCLLGVFRTEKQWHLMSGIFGLLTTALIAAYPIIAVYPRGTLARTLSIIPFWSPLVMQMRRVSAKLPLWEYAASWLLVSLIALIFSILCAVVFDNLVRWQWNMRTALTKLGKRL